MRRTYSSRDLHGDRTSKFCADARARVCEALMGGKLHVAVRTLSSLLFQDVVLLPPGSRLEASALSSHIEGAPYAQERCLLTDLCSQGRELCGYEIRYAEYSSFCKPAFTLRIHITIVLRLIEQGFLRSPNSI